MLSDLVERLRAMSRGEHDDHTIGDEAADALEAAREDVARLDWLEESGYPGQFYATGYADPDQRWFDSETVGSDYSPTLRAAIDAARKEVGDE